MEEKVNDAPLFYTPAQVEAKLAQQRQELTQELAARRAGPDWWAGWRSAAFWLLMIKGLVALGVLYGPAAWTGLSAFVHEQLAAPPSGCGKLARHIGQRLKSDPAWTVRANELSDRGTTAAWLMVPRNEHGPSIEVLVYLPSATPQRDGVVVGGKSVGHLLTQEEHLYLTWWIRPRVDAAYADALEKRVRERQQEREAAEALIVGE